MAEELGSSASQTTGPLTLLENGTPPTCRMPNAQYTVDFVQRLIDADDKRSRKRAAVDGLVDGNSPYSPAKLRSSGQANRCNVNWGTARSLVEGASGALYDLTSQAPGFACIEVGYGNPEQRIGWERTMCEKANLAFKESEDFDTEMQLSQLDTILHGTGPLLFEDADCVFPRYVPTEQLLVPDRTPCNTKRWDVASVLIEYYPPELYEFIENREAAEAMGWDVDYTMDICKRAVDRKAPDQRTFTAEWYQNELKSNSFNYMSNEDLVCKLAHVYWWEFPKDGVRKITHVIVDRTQSTGDCKYLFRHDRQYNTWHQCVHPMYYDRGRGGIHHNVTGLGVKMYGAMEYQNRLLCNAHDKAFGPKLLFKFGSKESQTKFEIASLGEYGVMPVGADFVQAPTNGFINDGLAMFRADDELMRSNLSQYRQQVEMERPGNPETATKEKIKASQQGSLANTTFARYYKQLDALYREIVNRLCNLNTSDPVAKKFQRECIAGGVPEECFGRISSVTAVRVIGQGSPYLRQEVVQSVAGVIQGCSEEGQENWRDDFIAAHAGAAQVPRWNPKPKSSQFIDDQKVAAGNEISRMRQGMPTIFSPSQNATTFAGTFINACLEAINSIPKGANPAEVLQFVERAGPAAGFHIRRLLKDPMRKAIGADFKRKWLQIMQMAKKIKDKLQAQAKQQQGLQKKANGVMTDAKVKAMKVAGDLNLKKQKQDMTLRMAAQKHRQQMAINDSRSASDISLARMRALNE
jgi:hypothetical protein